MTGQSGRCHYHPERLGMGVCVECRSVICRECSTQFEGINRCARCLAKKRADATTHQELAPWSAKYVLLALGAFVSFFLLVLLIAIGAE